MVQTGSHSEMGSEKFSHPGKSGYNKGTIRSDIRYLVASKDVRRHRLISISYVSQWSCHGRGREFESRRPRHFSTNIVVRFLLPKRSGQTWARARLYRTPRELCNYTRQPTTKALGSLNRTRATCPVFYLSKPRCEWLTC